MIFEIFYNFWCESIRVISVSTVGNIKTMLIGKHKF